MAGRLGPPSRRSAPPAGAPPPPYLRRTRGFPANERRTPETISPQATLQAPSRPLCAGIVTAQLWPRCRGPAIASVPQLRCRHGIGTAATSVPPKALVPRHGRILTAATRSRPSAAAPGKPRQCGKAETSCRNTAEPSIPWAPPQRRMPCGHNLAGSARPRRRPRRGPSLAALPRPKPRCCGTAGTSVPPPLGRNPADAAEL
jgi:hypothetical protein